MRIPACLVVGCALVAPAIAQTTLVTPAGYAAAEGGTNNAFPWNRGTSSTRIQFVVDSTHFTSQGVVSPINISQLRYRADAATATTTWAGGTWPNVRIDMASCPVNYLNVSTTFASNLGPDLATVHNGPVTVVGGAGNGTGIPGPWYITIPLTTPFFYDPTTGVDLTVDIYQDGTGWTGTSRAADHVTSTGNPPPLGRRVYNTSTTALTAPTGTVGLNYGIVTEFTYTPAAGLFPAFTASPPSVAAGAPVQFTDQSYSSAPGGVLARIWDLDGDGVSDSTAANPTFQYAVGGYYNVSLTVIDGQNQPQTLTKPAFIGVDLASANFTANVAGLAVQFTDASLNATSWAWDFQNDGVVDSTSPNPSFTYPAQGAYDCKLTVTNAYSTNTRIATLGIGIVPLPPFGSTFTSTATRGYWFQTPTRFSVVSMQVPDETNFGRQNVALYRLAGAPPLFSATATGGLEFVSTLQPSATPVPCAVSFDAGEFVGVLGACGDATTARNSYGTPAGPFASSVLGQPTTLTRMGTQFNLVATNGVNGYFQEPTGALSRVFLGVTGAVGLQYGTGTPSPYAAAPTIKTTALPILGQTAQITLTTNDSLAIGILAAGFGRAALPTPLGTLLVNGIATTDVVSGGALLTPGNYTYSFAIPNNPALNGFGPLNWQAACIVLPTGEFALSNATEWWLAN
ncbi:MAG: PKD domain-containing protein [Planctomycetota bacterium]